MKISASKLHTLLIAGESAAIEYKRCDEGPKADTFESICALLTSPSVIMSLAGKDFKCVVSDAKDEAVDLIDADTPPSTQVVAQRFGIADAGVTIAARPESAPYQLGDVDGDGKVDEIDLWLLAKLKSAAGRKWTANQLKAGDFNGNGKLDNADYLALRDLLKEKGLL